MTKVTLDELNERLSKVNMRAVFESGEYVLYFRDWTGDVWQCYDHNDDIVEIERLGFEIVEAENE